MSASTALIRSGRPHQAPAPGADPGLTLVPAPEPSVTGELSAPPEPWRHVDSVLTHRELQRIAGGLRPVLRVVRDSEPALPPTEDAPLPMEWVERLARVIIEVVSAHRPATQLRRWTSTEVYATLSRRAACAARHPAVRAQPPMARQVLSVRGCAVAPGVVEACAVVSGRTRARAIALRLEFKGGRWIATAVELG